MDLLGVCPLKGKFFEDVSSNITQNLRYLRNSIGTVNLHYFSMIVFHENKNIHEKKAQANARVFLSKTDQLFCIIFCTVFFSPNLGLCKGMGVFSSPFWFSFNSSETVKALNLEFCGNK